MNGNSNIKEEEFNQSVHTINDSDYLNNSSLDQSKTVASEHDLSKASKKRKSYKFFGLRKRGSKYSSQESH